MKGALIAAVVGLTMMGCATSVDDPVPAPLDPGTQAPPPDETYGATLRTPTVQFPEITATQRGNQVGAVPPHQVPDVPIPRGDNEPMPER